MKKKIYLKILICFVFASYLFLAGNVKAENVGLAVDKSFLFLGHDEGKNNFFSFKVTNKTTQKQIVHLEEKDISIGDNNEIGFIPADAGGPSSLVKFEKNDFPIEAGESFEVKGKLNLGDLKVGSAQMLTLVSFKSEQEQNVGSVVEGSIGVYTFLDDPSLKNAAGKIAETNFPWMIKGSDNYWLKYSNVGDKFFMPKGSLEIKNILNKSINSYKFVDHFVFAGKSVKFDLKDAPQISSFGLYLLSASFVDGNGDVSIKTQYAMGKFFPIVIIFILIILFFVGRFVKKQRNLVKS